MSIWSTRVLVYGAGDAVNGAGALDTQIQAQLDRLGRVATNCYVAAGAQLDAYQRPSLRFVLDPSGIQPVDQIADVDTGDPQELVQFVSWGVSMLPAQQTILVLSGHGVGWEDGIANQLFATRSPTRPARRNPRRIFGRRTPGRTIQTWGVLLDGSDHDFLSNAELASACDGVAQQLGAPIDVLVLDACLMMSWEVAFELVGKTHTIVASIDELSASGIDLAAPVLDLSTPQPHTAAEVAAAVVQRFVPQAPFDTCAALDLTAPAWQTAIAQFTQLSSQLLVWARATTANADAVRAALRTAAASVVKFASGGLADLGALAEAVATTPGIPATVRTAAMAAADALEACVLARSVGTDYQAAMGVSVFCPGSATVYAANRSDYNQLGFATQTGWGSLLDALYSVDAQPVNGVAAHPDAGAQTDIEYRISLRGLALDPAARDQVDDALRSTVADELAKLDVQAMPQALEPQLVPTRIGLRDIRIIMGMIFSSPTPDV